MQFGVAAFFELHGLAGLQFENGAPLLGLGDRELVRALLDLDAELLNLLTHVLNTMPQMQVCRAHDDAHEHQCGIVFKTCVSRFRSSASRSSKARTSSRSPSPSRGAPF